ncbi:MAG: glycosyltransferase family 9 protein [Flavobacteriaceae bacterium]
MKSPKHILVIRLSAMGDVAMTVPVLRALQQQHPHVRITMVSRKQFEPLFSGIPNCQFLAAEVDRAHKGFFGVIQLARKAKKHKIDAVADLHHVIRSNIMTWFFKTLGIRTATLNKGRAQKKALTKANGNPIQPLISTHERYANVFRELGFSIDLGLIEPLPSRELSPALAPFIAIPPQKTIGIAPFAAYSSKMYPLPLMEQVIELLSRSADVQILLFGGAAEKEVLEKMATPFSNVTSIAGQFSFEEELSLISNLSIMVSMDSANGHLAANFGVPVVTLWGVTHPYAGFAPFQQPMEHQLLSDRKEFPLIPTSVYGNTFPEGYEKVMESIEPITVAEKIKKILN